MAEGKKLDLLIYEFDTEEEAASYDKWVCARVQRSLDDPRPRVSHGQVVMGAEARRGQK